MNFFCELKISGSYSEQEKLIEQIGKLASSNPV